MACIEQIEAGDADGELARAYESLIEERGKVANIFKVESLNPNALSAHLDLYMTLMFGRSGLSRAEREAIAVVVSASNDCEYCVAHHVEALKRYVADEETLTTLARAENLDSLETRLGNIVMHAEKLNEAPGAMTESDLHDLRAVGLSDRDVLDLTLIVGYFNFVNRVAMGLGVALAPGELAGYADDGEPEDDRG